MPAIHHWACRQAVGYKFVDTENLAHDFHQSCSYALSYVSAPPPPQPLNPYRPYEHGSSFATAPPSSKSFSNVDHKLDSSAGSKSSVPATRRFKPRYIPIFVDVDCPLTRLTMKGSNNDKLPAMRIVAHVFEIIHLLADQSSIQEQSAGRPSIACLCDVSTHRQCLADELFDTAKGLCSLYAIEKKDELECVAKSNR
ncbi:hypothetical protein B0H13DRAFT_2345561 [Mycena leptocephala]|nr:hypothetical protein B0H13DRAFT_2345561 [Mycena leptocephala]